MTSAEPSADDLCHQARGRLAERDFAAAIELFETAILQDPDHIAAHEGLAAICFAKKDHARAVELFKRVVALDPRRVEPLVNLGAAYNRQGDFANAIKMLRMAVGRDRRCAAAYYNLGFAQRNAQQPGLAVSAFKEAIRLEPEMWEAYVNLGQTLLEMKNPNQAALNFERAVQLRPESARARQGLLTARSQIDSLKNAISPFGRLVDMEDVARQNRKDSARIRALSPEQRFDDRMQTHQFAREIEQCSSLLLSQLRQELSPAILSLSRLINDPTPAAWRTGIESLQLSHQRFQKMLQIVSLKVGHLREHDDRVRNMDPDK